MKKFFVFSILFSLFTYLLLPPVFSQTPTLYTSNCGFANAPGADSCCNSTTPDLNKAKEDAKKQAPQVGGILDMLPNINLVDMIPGLNQLYQKCYLGQPDTSSGKCICKQSVTPVPAKAIAEVICPKFTNAAEAEQCRTCARGGGILTQIGCVPLGVENFITDYVFKILVGLAGIISLLCIIYSAFQIQSSQGNPEKIKKAQEMLTSCIMGLMLIIFSVFILKLIGVDILRIPGFN